MHDCIACVSVLVFFFGLEEIGQNRESHKAVKCSSSKKSSCQIEMSKQTDCEQIRSCSL